MIRLGIIGSNYGRTVQLPAFRADRRCEVVALAGSDPKSAVERARDSGVPKGYGGWRALVEDDDVQVVAIATLPSLQVPIALRALELGKPVFAEKPMAADLAGAERMARAAGKLTTAVDFNFSAILSFRKAKDSNGCSRSVSCCHWLPFQCL